MAEQPKASAGSLEARVAELEKQVAELRRQLAKLGGAAESLWPADSFNYLAIGNSLTRHQINAYWWNDIGMAASDAEHDYFHLVCAGLRQRFGKVEARAVNFSIWERTGHDRDQALTDLDGLLDERLSLVTVQLGENVRDYATYQADYVSLLRHIGRKTGGRARILVIGNFWSEDDVRSAAAAAVGAEYLSLKAAHGDPKYQSRLGAVVFDAEGRGHVIEHAGVASHPGDAGMAFIADKVLAKLRRRAK